MSNVSSVADLPARPDCVRDLLRLFPAIAAVQGDVVTSAVSRKAIARPIPRLEPVTRTRDVM